MYPITSAVKALYDAEQYQVVRITGTDKNGTAISITEANIMQGGFSIDRYSCNGDKIEIGTAIASEMTLTLDNRNGQFNGIVFEGAELYVEIGIADWTQTNPTVTYMPCGYFTPDEQPRSLNTITLHALDRMARFDTYDAGLSPWTIQGNVAVTTGNGEPIYVSIDMPFPCTIKKMVEVICEWCSVPFTQDVSSLPNNSYVLSGIPDLQQSVSMRSLIQWCAGCMGANAWIDWTGSLQFSWYGAATGYVMTTANRFDSDLGEDDITVTGVQYTNTQGETIVSGSSTYALDLSGNYLAQTGVAQILPAVKNAVNNFSYRPFSATVISAPYLWPMDAVTFTDRNGNAVSTILTNVNFTLNGTTMLEARGMTEQTNATTTTSATTKQQALLIERAVEVTRELDASLDQEAIFNRLTDGGEMQGLILYNGKIYLNASYIQTGTLVADLIKGGILKMGGTNNQYGRIVMLNSNNEAIGGWDINGIVVGGSNRSNPSYSFANYKTGETVAQIKLSSVTKVATGEGIYSIVFYVNDGDSGRSVQLFSISGGASNSNEPSEIRFKSKLILDEDAETILRKGSTSYSTVSGSFTTADGKTVTVTHGMITNIIGGS